jgi:uncharacterized protein (TIGR00251 family)
MFTIEVKVFPSAGRVKWLFENDRLKCYLLSPAEKNKANNELIKLLAQALKISQDKITIVLGATNRIKRIKIDKDLTLQDVLEALGLAEDQQMELFKIKEK